jgi:hypothetical protein
LTIHRLLLTSLMCTAKFFDDHVYNNAMWANVGGGKFWTCLLSICHCVCFRSGYPRTERLGAGISSARGLQYVRRCRRIRLRVQ